MTKLRVGTDCSGIEAPIEDNILENIFCKVYSINLNKNHVFKFFQFLNFKVL